MAIEQQKNNNFTNSNLLFLLGIGFLGLLLGFIIFILLTATIRHGIVSSPSHISTVYKSFTQPPASLRSSITENPLVNICEEQHAGYPLVHDILTSKATPNIGVYQAVVVNPPTDTNSFLVTASLPKGHIFTFDNNSLTTTIYDIYHHRVTKLSDVKRGDKLIISFSCKQQGATLSLLQIQIVK